MHIPDGTPASLAYAVQESINLITAYRTRWQHSRECTMRADRSFARRDANLPLISLIIDRRRSAFLIDATNRPPLTQIKNDSHDVYLIDFSTPDPVSSRLRVKPRAHLTWDRTIDRRSRNAIRESVRTRRERPRRDFRQA